MSRYCSTCRLTGEHPETRRLLNPANIEPVESSGAAAADTAADTAATANVEFDVDATTFDNAVDMFTQHIFPLLGSGPVN